MLSFSLATLNSADANSDVLAAWELAAFFMGEASPKDLPIDEDLDLNWYISERVAEEDKGSYAEEVNFANTEMMESFEKELLKLALERSEALGDCYPLGISNNNQLVRRNDTSLNTVGASYLLLQFFRGHAAGTIEIDGIDDAEVAQKKAKFESLFRKVFEYIAGYTVSGGRKGVPHMTSHCRSSQRLQKLLTHICKKIGAGAVKPYNIWNARQLAANDGGIDCLIHAGGPGTPGDAEIILVGATVQKNKIDEKIVGPEKINFFTNFFSTQPAAFRGALVRAQDENEITKYKCIEKNCLIYTYENVWRLMGKRYSGDYQLKSISRLDANARKLLFEFSKSVFLHEHEKYSPDIN